MLASRSEPVRILGCSPAPFDAPRTEALDGVVLGRAGDLLLRAVLELVVLGGVRIHAPYLRVDQSRTLAAPGPLDSFLAHRVGGRTGGALHAHPDHALTSGAVRDVPI